MARRITDTISTHSGRGKKRIHAQTSRSSPKSNRSRSVSSSQSASRRRLSSTRMPDTENRRKTKSSRLEVTTTERVDDVEVASPKPHISSIEGGHAKRMSPHVKAMAVLVALLTITAFIRLSTHKWSSHVIHEHSPYDTWLQTVWQELVSAEYVFWYGWVTAASASLGVLPLLVFPDFTANLHAIANSVAGGMMIAASAGLMWEGALHEASPPSPGPMQDIPVGTLKVLLGFAAGLLFIVLSKRVLSAYEHLSVVGFEGASAGRALLVLAVMTLHSLAEGAGIGVSFGSEQAHFGVMIAATLAVHNVPEGLATCLVLLPRGPSHVEAALWAFFTSLPQPLMAVPAFIFVKHFTPVLPVALGFSAGAMMWVACFELVAEAYETLGLQRTFMVTSASTAFMIAIQIVMR